MMVLKYTLITLLKQLVDYEILLTPLSNFDIDGTLSSWLSSYLEDHTM